MRKLLQFENVYFPERDLGWLRLIQIQDYMLCFNNTYTYTTYTYTYTSKTYRHIKKGDTTSIETFRFIFFSIPWI